MIKVVRFDELTTRELDAWHTLRAANPMLDSPYFHPGFAQAVHASGTDVQVVVYVQDGGRVHDGGPAFGGGLVHDDGLIHGGGSARDGGPRSGGGVGRDGGPGQDGEPIAFLACHREGALVRPVGWPGADFQGPVLAPGTSFPIVDVLSGGVRRFGFDHLLDLSPDFEPWVESWQASPYVDVSGGLDGYLGRASRSGKDNVGQARRRARKAERELGPVKFVADNPDPAILDRVVELKRGQYAATGARDYFADARRRDLVERLLRTRGSSFGGVLSTVHAGPHLIAAHFGLRADHVLHWWFPVYDPEFAHLAPGWILLRELVTAAPELGFTRIDLGRGDDEYKRRAKTGEVMVAQGLVTRSTVHRLARRAKDRTIAAAKASPVGPALRRVVRKVRAQRS